MAKTDLQCFSAKLSLGLSLVPKATIYAGVAQDLLGVCAGDGVEKTNARSERRIQSRGRKRNGLRVPGQYSRACCKAFHFLGRLAQALCGAVGAILAQPCEPLLVYWRWLRLSFLGSGFLGLRLSRASARLRRGLRRGWCEALFCARGSR